MAAPSDTARQAREKIQRWRSDPVAFVVENFGVVPDAWQEDALRVCGGPANPKRRLCMKACTGPGKSATLAWLGWHRLSCFASKGEHPKGAAISITADNLKDNLWPELAKWQARSKFLTAAFTWTKEKIYSKDFPETWFLSARSFAKDANEEAIGRALSGLHSKFPFVLMDETGSMPIAVGKAAQQIFTGMAADAALIQAGNPTDITGLLYDSCVAARGLWDVITVTADPDDPKRTPRVSIDHAREMIQTYGRDNPWVMATILGLFPPAGFNSLLSVDDVERAMQRHYREPDYAFAARLLGADVARFGDDASVIASRQGLVAFPFQALRNVDSIDGAGTLGRRARDWEADAIFVDGTGGYGAGWIDALRRLGFQPIDVQFAGKPNDPRFANKRAEIWWEMAEWIKGGGALPPDPLLVAELTTPTYSFKGDRILIEDKALVKERLGRSPDRADALAVTFAQPVQPRARPSMLPAVGPRSTSSRDWSPLDRR